MPKRKVYNITQFVEGQSESVAEICSVLHDLFLSYPNVKCFIRYNIPFYDYRKWVCYINPLKKSNAVELVFLNGKVLKESFEFRKDRGRKMVAGIEIDEINDAVLQNVVMVWEEAILSNN
ncbi:DUF1801 domain-containing protein [Portibacter marinus]|uniref:DUF1801 domain-containing protein n=1 Tax=Portibacter marinus TaxID=2898660 RepID=UPI001F335072|nr:DUF1801 domain-containing protein [Portibacter marinus]